MFGCADSFAQRNKMEQVLRIIVSKPEIHVKWLNTLSFMENVGARKISACEHKTHVDIIQLKHAAEEHRHAYYLKKQIQKLLPHTCENYESHSLLAANATRYYLHKLDINVCRLLKEKLSLSGEELKYAAYLFVTYAIEVRADALYPQYQKILTLNQQKVMVKSIIVEEEGHLEEMITQLKDFHPNWKKYASEVMILEELLFKEWITAIGKEVLDESNS